VDVSNHVTEDNFIQLRNWLMLLSEAFDITQMLVFNKTLVEL